MTEQWKLFDVTDHLDSESVIADYLKAELTDYDPEHFIAALGNVARARSMTKIAEATGLGRESLYKALQPGSKVRFETIQKILNALGVKLTVEAIGNGKSEAAE